MRDELRMTAKQTLQEWISCFETLEYPRGRQEREHNFLDIVMIAILGVIGGREGWDDIKLYAESHQVWLEQLLNLKTEYLIKKSSLDLRSDIGDLRMLFIKSEYSMIDFSLILASKTLLIYQRLLSL